MRRAFCRIARRLSTETGVRVSVSGVRVTVSGAPPPPPPPPPPPQKLDADVGFAVASLCGLLGFGTLRTKASSFMN